MTMSIRNLYHVEVQWPRSIPTTFDNVPVVPSKHARDRAVEKGIELPHAVSGKAFECEYINGRLTKLALRCRYNSTHDLCVVLSSGGLLITAWLNSKQDIHRTLDRSKYTK